MKKKSKSKSRRKNSDGMDGIPQLFLSELVPARYNVIN